MNSLEMLSKTDARWLMAESVNSVVCWLKFCFTRLHVCLSNDIIVKEAGAFHFLRSQEIEDY